MRSSHRKIFLRTVSWLASQNSPFVHNEVALAWTDPLQVFLSGVDVGEDWHDSDDEAEDPGTKNQGNDNISTEI